MKKILLFLYLSTFIGMQLKAQEAVETDSDTLFYSVKPSAEGKLKIGVSLGIQASLLSGGESSMALPIIGITGGTTLRYNFAKKFTFQPAISIGFKGSRFNRTEPDYYNSLKLLYLEAPIQFFYTYQQQSKNQVGVGFYYAELINASLSSNSGSLVSNQTKLPIQEFDFGGIASWQLKFSFFHLQTSYKVGLSNINNGQAWPAGDNASIIKPTNKGGSFYNQTISLQLIF